MVNLIIDNKPVAVPEGTTILEAAAQLNINIPHLCYLKDYNDIGACRMCVVEVEGIERLVASCNSCAEEGMVVCTNSPKVRTGLRSSCCSRSTTAAARPASAAEIAAFRSWQTT